MENINRATVSLLFVMALIIGSALPVHADTDTNDIARIEFLMSEKCTITNAEGAYLNYDGSEYSGTMEVFDESYTPSRVPYAMLIVKNSKSFTFKGTMSPSEFTASGDGFNASAQASNCKSYSIYSENGEMHIELEGNNIDYSILMLSRSNAVRGVTIEGKANNGLEAVDKKEGISISGATSAVHFVSENYRTNEKQTINIIPTDDPILISNLAGRLKIKNALKLASKSYKRIGGIHAQKTMNEQALLVYWVKVKKADGYIVYRYDRDSKKYDRVATLDGSENRAWIDKRVVPGHTYRYRVATYTNKYIPPPVHKPLDPTKVKKMIGRQSYAVSAITKHASRDNATQVTLEGSGITGKVGGTAKLKAKVTASEGRTLVSKKLKWCSTNKKVARVDRRGNVKFLKKGTCYIYAKAHNGQNSNRVKVTVKR
jgi:uncharacterized protein YjdB